MIPIGAVTVVGLSACSTRESASADDASGTGFTLTDQRGKTLTFDGPINRIVTTIMPSPPMLAAVAGSYDQVVGCNESTVTANKQGIFGTMFPASTRTPAVAGSDFVPNVETILSLKPDVVLQWADQGEEILAPLEKAGLKVVGLTYGTQEDLETWVTLFGKLMGQDQRAQEILDWMHREDAAVRQLAAGGQSPAVLYLNRAGDGFSTCNGSTYFNHWIELAGGVNPAKSQKAAAPQVSTEQLLSWDPEVILLGGFDSLTPADIYRDAKLASLRAVKNKRVYKIPLGGYRWDPPNCESPLMWRWVAQVLHNGADHGLRDSIVERYRFLYNYEVTPDMVDDILRWDLNAASAGYDGYRA